MREPVLVRTPLPVEFGDQVAESAHPASAVDELSEAVWRPGPTEPCLGGREPLLTREGTPAAIESALSSFLQAFWRRNFPAATASISSRLMMLS